MWGKTLEDISLFLYNTCDGLQCIKQVPETSTQKYSNSPRKRKLEKSGKGDYPQKVGAGQW